MRAAIWDEMVKTHTQERYAGPITFFRAIEQSYPANHQPQVPWQEMAAGGWRQFNIPGDHYTIMSQRSGSVAMIASILNECLQSE